MTAEQEKKSFEGFRQALEKPAAERESFIVEYAPGDEAVQARIRQALATYEKPPDIPLLGVGHYIGAYRIKEPLGGGGGGYVYLATDPDGAQVAVKVLRTKRVKTELDRARYLEAFRQERQRIADLDHPNIIRLLDGGIIDGGSSEGGLPYSVMEYVDGQPIDAYCNRRELSVNQRLELFMQVCEAVAHVHRRFVVHCDLKPGNMLVTEAEKVTGDGKITKEREVKLLDFGISALVGSQPQGLTLEYACPEQVSGAEVSTAFDVYALGVILYEIMTGYPPHSFQPGLSDEEKKQVICDVEVKPLRPSVVVERGGDSTNGVTKNRASEIVSRTPRGKGDKLRRRLKGDLDSIILKALDKDPRQRYELSSELAKDIERSLAHFPVAARQPPPLFYRSTKWMRRNWFALPVIALLLLLMIYGSARFVRQYVVMLNAESAARRSSETAVNLSRFVAFDMQDEIKRRLPDSLPARRKLAELVLSYLSDLEPKEEANTSRQREIGDAYYELGNKFREVDSGDAQLALRCYGHALAIREKLDRKDPSYGKFRKELAETYYARSTLKQDLGDWRGAEEDRRKAIELGR